MLQVHRFHPGASLKLENILDTLKGVIHRGGTREKASEDGRAVFKGLMARITCEFV